MRLLESVCAIEFHMRGHPLLTTIVPTVSCMDISALVTTIVATVSCMDISALVTTI